MGLSRLRPKALVRYLDVICEEIITVVHRSTVAVLRNFFFYLYYVLHLKKAVSDGIKVSTQRFSPCPHIQYLQAQNGWKLNTRERERKDLSQFNNIICRVRIIFNSKFSMIWKSVLMSDLFASSQTYYILIISTSAIAQNDRKSNREKILSVLLHFILQLQRSLIISIVSLLLHNFQS